VAQPPQCQIRRAGGAVGVDNRHRNLQYRSSPRKRARKVFIYSGLCDSSDRPVRLGRRGWGVDTSGCGSVSKPMISAMTLAGTGHLFGAGITFLGFWSEKCAAPVNLLHHKRPSMFLSGALDL
jgi:hypothetical protein